MPSLAELTDQYPQQDTSLPVAQPYRGANLGPLSAVGVPTGVVGGDPTVAAPVPAIQPDPNSVGTSGSGSQIIDKLLGLGGQERYQLWPEKVVRDAISAPHDIIQANPYPEGSEENSWFEDQRQNSMVPAALNMSALAGTGGLAGTGAEVGEALGAGPFLRPALKVGDKIYKAPIKDAENPLGFGAEHSDALPAHLADDFYKKAMSGEDINHYNFGFVNHKGQFLDRGKALDYGIEQGLVDPQNGKYGVLTSTMLADSSKPGAAIEAMAKTGQPFYSALEHNVNAIPQAKMTGDQWLGTLANKPGVKPEEMDWTGVKDFLKEKGNQPVTKAELQEHLQNNKVELKEVDKGKGDLDKAVKAFENESSNGAIVNGEKVYSNEMLPWLLNGDLKVSELPTNLQPLAKDVLREHGNVEPTKYHSYQLPGGENYREKLLTLPPTQNTLNQFKVINEHGHVESTWTDKAKADAWAAKNNYTVREDKPVILNGGYKSSHWDEPNILAHVRMNDRMIDGKKSLHLEEIQSDWHQQGKKSGYDDPVFRKAAEEKLEKAGYPVSGEDARGAYEDGKITKEEAAAIGNRSYIPNAPFKKSWHELTLKRMIREAAEKGYDRLSWTPGEAQAARYDLSKSVDKLAYDPRTGHLQGFKDGGMSLDNQVPKDKLADFVGKEAAEKLLNKPTKVLGNGYHTLENADLKIGGEGMKGFYDQIIPKALEKISGEKVKTANLPYPTLSNKIGAAPIEQPVHYIDIPQSLKDKALGKGFPLFSSTHIFTPVLHNPFSNEKKK